jgi:predicted O-methyltransferase YrrM
MPMPDPNALRSQVNRRLRRLRRGARGLVGGTLRAWRGDGENTLQHAIAATPLLFADKTYNTSHPDYEAELVGNFPDRFFDADLPSENVLFLALRKLAGRNEVPKQVWESELRDVMEEASTVPGFDQVMERKAYIEKYLDELKERYQSHYVAGWVSLRDAQFLYWAVRRLKPKTIVQTGVSNGLSSAFMMLALAKNGPDGRLHVIDLPAIFDPNDSAWTQRGTVYGVVIPQGKASGWMVPDIYRDRFEVQIGDAKVLLPGQIDRLDTFDMFFHDSDHTYQHMIFEFEQAMRKLTPNGVIVADDISWNASLWDFAGKLRVPSYNFRGTLGVAFLSSAT